MVLKSGTWSIFLNKTGRVTESRNNILETLGSPVLLEYRVDQTL